MSGIANFGGAVSIALLLAGCASSAPYVEHQGAYRVITAPPAEPAEDVQVSKAQTPRRQDGS